MVDVTSQMSAYACRSRSSCEHSNKSTPACLTAAMTEACPVGYVKQAPTPSNYNPAMSASQWSPQATTAA